MLRVAGDVGPAAPSSPTEVEDARGSHPVFTAGTAGGTREGEVKRLLTK